MNEPKEPKEPIRNRIKKYIANNQVNERVKTHYEKHKIKYAVGGAIIATTAVNYVYFATKRKHEMAALATLSITSANNGGHHNTINNIENLNVFYKRVSKYGNPLGRPGIPVLDITDPMNPKRYESEVMAAKALGVNPSIVSRHLHDQLEHAGGHKLITVDAMKAELQRGVAERIACHGTSGPHR